MSSKVANNLIKSLAASLTQANRDVVMIRRASNLASFLEQRHTELTENKINSVYEYFTREFNVVDKDMKERLRRTFREKVSQKCSGFDDNGKKLADQPSVLMRLHSFTVNNGLNVRLDLLETDCDFASGSPYGDLLMLLLNACPVTQDVELFAKEVVEAVKAFEQLETEIDEGKYEDENDAIDASNIRSGRTRSSSEKKTQESQVKTSDDKKDDDDDDDDDASADAAQADEGEVHADEAQEAEQLLKEALAKKSTLKLSKSEEMLKMIDDLFYLNLKHMFDRLASVDFFGEGFEIQDRMTAQKSSASKSKPAKKRNAESAEVDRPDASSAPPQTEKRRIVDASLELSAQPSVTEITQ